MNHTYKTLYNTALGAWVAVPEIARNRGKAPRSYRYASGAHAFTFARTALASALLLVGGQAWAAIPEGTAAKATDIAIGTGASADSKISGGYGSTAVGTNAKATSRDDVAIGYGAGAKSGSGASSGRSGERVMIGANANVGSDREVKDIYVGGTINKISLQAKEVGQAVAIGGGTGVQKEHHTYAYGDQSLAIGSDTLAYGDSSVAIGGDDLDQAGSQQTTYTASSGQQKTDTVRNAYHDLTGDTMQSGVYAKTVSKQAAVAVGVQAQAADLGVALGAKSGAANTNSVAIGTGAQATLDNAVAIGGGSKTRDPGTKQESTTINGVTYNWAGGGKTLPGDIVSFGAEDYERQLKHVAAGKVSADSTDAINGSQLYAVAAATSYLANGDSPVVRTNAAGEPLKKATDGNYYKAGDVNADGTPKPGAAAQTPVALTLVNHDGTTTTPTTLRNVAAGTADTDAVNVSQIYNYAHVNDGTAAQGAGDALTNKALVNEKGGATGKFAIAVGVETVAAGENSTAAGYGALATNTGDTAIGKNSTAKGGSSIAMGEEANAEAADSVVIGKKARAQAATASGDSGATTAVGAVVIGSNAKGSGTNATAVGQAANAFGQNSFAGGQASKALGKSSVAVGDGAQASKDAATATGAYSSASGAGATANGYNSKAEADASVAIGHSAVAKANGAGAFGKSAQASASKALAFGDSAVAGNNDAVALGSGAKTAAAVGTNTATVGALIYSGFAGAAPVATVSVGDAGKERTITNVAAGRINNTSTDAINGSQLYWTQDAISNVGKSSKNILGGNAAMDNRGNITMSNIGDTGENTVHDAIKAVKATANKGWNVQTNGSGTTNVAPGDTVNFKNGTNIAITHTGKEITIATNPNLTADKLTINNGGPVLDNSGINMGNKGISNMADGNIANGSKEAVNGGQLFQTNQNVTNNAANIAKGINFGDGNTANNYQLGDTINVKGDNNITSTTVNGGVQLGLKDTITVGPANGGNPVTINGNAGTVGGLSNKTWNPNNIVSGQAATEDQLKAVADEAAKKGSFTLTAQGANGSTVGDGATVDLNNTDGNISVSKNAANNNVTFNLAKDIKVDSVKAGDSTINNDGLKITGGPSVTKTGIDAANKKITNVADGNIAAGSKDAVNGGQLHNEISKLNTNIAAAKTEVQSTDKSVTVDGSKKNPTTGATIYDLSVNTDGTTITKDANGKIKANTTTLTTTAGKVNTPAAADAGKLMTAGEIANAINNSGFTLTTSASSGTVSGTSNQLINPGNTMTLDAGKNINIIQDGRKVTVATKDQVEFTQVTTTDAAGNKTVTNGNGVTITPAAGGGNPVSLTDKGLNNGGNTITNVAPGVNDTDAANVQQVKAARTEVKAGTNIASVDKTQANDGHDIYTVNAKGTTVSGAGDVIVTATNTGGNVTNYEVSLSNGTKQDIGKGVQALNIVQTQGLTFHGDSGSTGVKKLGDSVAIMGDGNIRTAADAGGVQVKLNPDVNVNSVTTGDTRMSDEGVAINNGPSMTKQGIDAGNLSIRNVAPGRIARDSRDAVNGAQLYALGRHVDNVDKRAKAGTASAIATAGLPQAYRPGASMVAAAGGYYDGQSAVAIGVSTISDNGKWIIKGAANVNSKEAGAVVGIGYQW